MTEPTLQVRRRHLRWEQLDDEIVILDLAGSAYLKLSGAGVVLWKALLGGATPQALVEVLLGEYDIDRASAERDVRAFLTRMRGARLVELRGSGERGRSRR